MRVSSRWIKGMAAGFAMLLGLGAASPAVATPVVPVGLIANGSFELDFASASIASPVGGGASWFIESANTTLLIGFPTVGPARGNFLAVTDQFFPSASILLQSFSLPYMNTGIVTFSFDTFVNDSRGEPGRSYRRSWPGPEGLDEIRFGEVIDIDVLDTGVDSVSILVVPEPSTNAMMFLGLAGLAIVGRRTDETRRG